MLDEVKEVFKSYGPPLPFALVVSVMIWGQPNNTLANWPIFGEFVMDSALKGMLIALAWFVFFSSWTIWRLVNPNYNDATYLAVREAREYADKIDINTTDPVALKEYLDMLGGMESKIPKGTSRRAFSNMYDCIQRLYGFQVKKHVNQKTDPSEESVERYLVDVEKTAEAIVKFKDKVEWANNK